MIPETKSETKSEANSLENLNRVVTCAITPATHAQKNGAGNHNLLELPEEIIAEILSILSMINSLLMLAKYQQNNSETDNLIFQASTCIANLKERIKDDCGH